MEELQLEHTSGHWRLFTDLSRSNLKVVSLDNGNKFPSVYLVHAVQIKET
jgi:hypothetical protein